MTAQKKRPPAAGMGRIKGSKNKLPQEVKAAIQTVFDDMGGTKRFQEWAEDNLTEFYKLYAKLLPKNIHVDVTPRLILRDFGSSKAEKIIHGEVVDNERGEKA